MKRKLPTLFVIAAVLMSAIAGIAIAQEYSIDDLEEHDTLSVSPQDSPTSVRWNGDGTKLFYTGNSPGEVAMFEVSDPYNISTAGASERVLSINNRGLQFNDVGTRAYLSLSSSESIRQYNLSTPYDFDSVEGTTSLSVSSVGSLPRAVSFADGGGKMYVPEQGNDVVAEYSLSTPYEVNTATHVRTYNHPNNMVGTFVTEDGTSMFILESSGDGLIKYNLSTPYDVTTGSLESSFSVPTSAGFDWNDDGTRLYVITTSGTIVEYRAPFTPDVTLEVDGFMQGGDSQSYTIHATVEGSENLADITDDGDVTVMSDNTSLLEVIEGGNQITARTNISGTANITAEYEYDDGEFANDTVEIFVGDPSIENLEHLPSVWRVNAVFGGGLGGQNDEPGGGSQFQFILFAVLAGVIASNVSTSFAGIGTMQLVLIVGWFAGWVTTGLMLVCLFYALFVGLNLAANIDYAISR